ncbi:hypothetical protein [Streptomyces sp. NPDC102476]
MPERSDCCPEPHARAHRGDLPVDGPSCLALGHVRIADVLTTA